MKASQNTKMATALLALCLMMLTCPLFAVHAKDRAVIRRQNSGAASLPLQAGTDWALVVGIDEYADPAIPDLSTAVNDARAVADLLAKRLGFDQGRIATLYNSQATRANIAGALDRLSVQAGEHDRVLIYYAGHGELRYRGKSSFEIRDPKTIQEMKRFGMGFWIPANARLGASAGYLSNAELRAYLAQIFVDHLLVVSDSCYSGGLTQRGFDPQYPEGPLKEAVSLRSRLLLASGGLHPVPDTSRIPRCAGHSTFACYFLKFLEEAPGGALTARKLYARMYEPVVSNSPQEPRLDKFLNMGHEGGQFVFVIDEPDNETLLTVESNVSGAWVRLNGREIGKTPLRDAPVPPGDHRVSVGKDGYETERRPLMVEQNRHARLHFNLKPKSPEIARLYVYADPEEARVRILNIGPRFRQGMELSPGRYELEASAEGCETRTAWVMLVAGRDEHVDMPLKCGGEDRFTNSLGMEFVRIPKGCFQMGQMATEKDRLIADIGEDNYKRWFARELPRHEVCLTRDFFMATTEVTVGQWRSFANTTAYRTEAEKGDGTWVWTGSEWDKKADANWKNPYFSQDDGHPVTCVSWNDAVEFIKWLNQKEGKSYRLPTEAEWEYAARAGTTTPFTYGRCLSTDQANYNGNYPLDGCPKGKYRKKTIPVGSLNAPNSHGLHDMHGNVWEWCQDWYGDYPSSSVTDPAGPSSGPGRVLRGGGWNYYARYCRSANRFRSTADDRYANHGFRLVLPAGR